jgi:hypothetical protein
MNDKDAMKLDPLRRVFVYNDRRFHTHDGVYYQRGDSGDTIRRQLPKVRGKSARRADKRLRHAARREQ